MKKVIAAINMTLDGDFDHRAGLPDEEIHQHYTQLLEKSGVILYGRITYQLMEFWQTFLENPSEEKSMNEFALAIDKVPKKVFSKTLQNVKWKSATIAKGDLKDEVLELKKQSGKDILIGSRSLIIQLLNLDLIDELQLCIYPVIGGKGWSLFENINERRILKFIKTKTFGSGAVLLYYAPKNLANPNYHSSFFVNSSGQAAYRAITESIAEWWTEDFSGTANTLNAEFTVRFGTTFKTMKVIELIPNEKVVWSCIDTLIDMPELKNKEEWKDTKIVWEIEKKSQHTNISLTHIGLTPRVACYAICEKGWESFLESLKSFLEKGKGTPFTVQQKV